MKHKVCNHLGLGLAWVAGLLLPATLLAESAVVILEEVVVTARKSEEKIQDIPASITAISSEQIEREAVRSIQDVARLTPGLIFDLGFVPQDTRPQIRGLPATRGRPPVGLLIDNIDVSSESMQTAGGGMIGNVRLLDLERVEVLKGPQSVLYGRAAFAGAINYVTAKAILGENSFKVSGDFGSFSRVEGRIVGNSAISDGFAMRGSLSYAKQDGAFTNTVTGRKVGGFDSKGGTAAAQWRPNDNFTLNARLAVSNDHYDVRPQAAYGFATGQSQNYAVPAALVGICLGLLPAGFTAAAQTTCPAGSARVGANGVGARTGVLQGYNTITLSVDPLTGKDFPGTDLKSNVASVNFDWDIGALTLTSWTGYAKANQRSRQDVDSYGALPVNVIAPTAGVAEPRPYLQVVDLDTDTTQYSQEFRLGGAFASRLRWSVGAQYWHEQIGQLNYGYTINTAAARSAARAVQQLGAPPPADEAKTTRHLGYYGTLEFDLTSKLMARVEGRHNDEKYDYRWLSPARGVIFPATVSPPETIVWTTPNYAINGAGFKAFTPRGTVQYKFTPDVMVYAVAAKGFKAGGFITLAGTPADFAAFEPESLWSYELGSKTTLLGGRAHFNANFFYMKNENKLFTTLEPDTRSVTGTSLKASNNSDALTRGVELEFAMAVTDHFSFSTQYSYTDGVYTRFAPLTTGTLAIAYAGNCTIGEVAAAPNPTTGAARVVRYCITSNKGLALERAPKSSASATLTYKHPLNANYGLLAEASGQYVGERPEGANIAGILFGSYLNVDARFGLEGKAWNAYLYSNNLTDDKTIRSGQSGGDFASAGNQLIGTYFTEPRTFGLRFGYNF
jgi:outer membrane receptor protein involved in Fe transport